MVMQVVLLLHRNPEAADALQCQADVARRFQGWHNGQVRIAVQQRQGEQKARHELGTHVAGKHVISRLQAAMHRQGQMTVRSRPVRQSLFSKNIVIGLFRTGYEFPVARKGKRNACQGSQGNEEAQCRARFPAVRRAGAVQLFPGPAFSVGEGLAPRRGRFRLRYGDIQGRQAAVRRLDILRQGDVVHRAGAFGQAGADAQAVAHALGRGNRHRAVQAGRNHLVTRHVSPP